MDCTWITAHRTGAASALSARFLARPESETVGILACGVQGRTNLEAMTLEFPVKRAFAYDIQPATQRRFVEEMGAKLGIEVVGVDNPRAAVAESDLVVTSGPILKNPTPTIQAGWLRPGAFASAVDFDCYWSPAALAEFDQLTTDDHAQFQYYRRIGYFQHTPEPDADLGELVAEAKPGRERRRSADDRDQPRARARRHGRGARNLPAGGRARPGHAAAALSPSMRRARARVAGRHTRPATARTWRLSWRERTV